MLPIVRVLVFAFVLVIAVLAVSISLNVAGPSFTLGELRSRGHHITAGR